MRKLLLTILLTITLFGCESATIENVENVDLLELEVGSITRLSYYGKSESWLEADEDSLIRKIDVDRHFSSTIEILEVNDTTIKYHSIKIASYYDDGVKHTITYKNVDDNLDLIVYERNRSEIYKILEENVEVDLVDFKDYAFRF